MADLDALTQQILARPDDDAPRLAYAAALGDVPRAELIRTQVEMEREYRQHGQTDRWSQLYRREQVLLDGNRRQWGSHLADLAHDWWFRRGFVEHVAIDAKTFVARADELYRRAPVRHLDVRGAQPAAWALFSSPSLARIRSLALKQNDLGDAEVKLLADSPHLGELYWLDLSWNKIGLAGVEALAASTALPRLGWVALAQNPVENPVPRPGGVDYDGAIMDMEIPKLGLELQRKYGKRDWLSSAYHTTSDYPPDRYL